MRGNRIGCPKPTSFRSRGLTSGRDVCRSAASRRGVLGFPGLLAGMFWRAAASKPTEPSGSRSAIVPLRPPWRVEMLSFFRNRRRPTPPTSARRRIALEMLESRNLFAALPLGATPADTAEFMLGRVAVVPVLFESNGGVTPIPRTGPPRRSPRR